MRQRLVRAQITPIPPFVSIFVTSCLGGCQSVPIQPESSVKTSLAAELRAQSRHHRSSERSVLITRCARGSMHSVLLVEDDDSIRAALSNALTERDFAVVAVATAGEALRAAAAGRLDIVLLDLGLPDLDGTAALRMIRGISSVPVIIVTARRGETSVVRLLDAGADDYVVKPFSADHLVARMRALLRRTSAPSDLEQPVITAGGLQIDLLGRNVLFHGQRINLTRREFDLLVYLAERPNRVVSRSELCDQVWAGSEKASDQTIDVHLSWLRRKLGETAAKPRYLHTVRGVGVKLVVSL